MPFIAQLEPDALLETFLARPPTDFVAERSQQGMPVFVAQFDLSTTADVKLQRFLAMLPLYERWKRVLTWRVCFVGSTVTEYAPLPPGVAPAATVEGLLDAYGDRCRLLIVKDIAWESPLLLDADNAYAKAFAESCERKGFVLLEGQALAWVLMDFASEDEYLARLSYGRRKNIRRKLRSRSGLDIEAVPAGDSRFFDPVLLAAFYGLFENVYAQSRVHFDHLTREFLRDLLQDRSSGGVVFIYNHAGTMIGWNLCYVFGGKLLDKYMGMAYPDARMFNLYFVSWMHNLRYALEHGLSHYVAGWTDPEVKSFLGARMTFTRHAVYARNPALRWLLRRVRHQFEQDSRLHHEIASSNG